MKVSISHLQSLLKEHSYKAVFSAYHAKKDIETYKKKKDAVDPNTYFTVLTPSGHVIGRLIKIRRNSRFIKKDDIEILLEFFHRYDISNRNKIIHKLQSLLKSIH